MALDDLLISTGVDQLIRLVREKGKIEIGAAAKELRQPLRTIEDWSHVLEEEGLVRIDYKLTKAYLVWQNPTREYIAQKSDALSAKADQAKGEIDEMLGKVETGGQELAGMKKEVARLREVSAFDPAQAESLRKELAVLDKKYSSVLSASSEKLDKLRKKLLAMGPKVGKAPAGGNAKAADELASELEVLKKFEQTLEAQIGEGETYFDAFSARLEDFRKGLEEGRTDEALAGLKAELAEAKGIREELVGALEAVVEEHKALSEKLSATEEKVRMLSDSEGSIEGARKKLAELRRIAEEAAAQKKTAMERLSDSVSLVKKQSARVKELLDSQAESGQKVQQLKDDYVDIAEEISRAGEEIASRRKEASATIKEQMEALSALQKTGGAGVDGKELDRITGLLDSLEAQRGELEGKVRALLKEMEVLKMEAVPVAASGAPAAPEAGEPGRQVPEAFVEKVRLSREEEDEFERKREELRALIRRMWEESKGGKP